MYLQKSETLDHSTNKPTKKLIFVNVRHFCISNVRFMFNIFLVKIARIVRFIFDIFIYNVKCDCFSFLHDNNVPFFYDLLLQSLNNLDEKAAVN